MMGSLILAMVGGVAAWGGRHEIGASPILAGLLCASCFLRRRDVAVVGLGAMLVHDLLLGLSTFTLVRLVGIVGVMGVIWALRVRLSFTSLLVGTGLSSLAFHVILAVGDWATRTCSTTPLTMQGLAASIASSLPYLQRSLIGEMAFTGAFLALYTVTGYLVARRWPAVLPQPSHD